MMMDGNIELRKLPADCLSPVEETLQTNEDWKTFMNLIPKSLENLTSEHYEPKYNGEDIALIENHANETKVKCAKVLFAEWGTSGRVRPTLNTLLTLLVKAEMFKAADAIANILGIPPPERPLDGPPAVINTSVTNLLNTECSTRLLSSSTSDRGNDTTKKLKSHNLIEFSANINSIVQQNDQSKLETVTDMMKFTKTAESQYLPASDILNPKTNGMESTSSETSKSTGYSGTSHIHPPATQNEQSQSSSFKDQVDQDILQNDDLIQFEFKHLEAITNDFQGTLIGSGGFGDVFLGTHDALGLLAVKKVHNTLSFELVSKMFNTEVRSLSMLRHPNIVPILGFSLDGPDRCIVCEYIDGGSLRKKIADKVLNKQQRLDIMLGTAEGLKYVHSTVKPTSSLASRKAYFIHGDVKSVNILLTKDCIPKLCDFGLAKQFDNTYVTGKILGTQYYMSPESLTGTITQKSDVYSFGIVLLELLTGLDVVVNDNGAYMNIKTYLKEYSTNGDITEFVDKVVGEWIEAQSIYGIAKRCLENESTDRPSMVEICSELLKI